MHEEGGGCAAFVAPPAAPLADPDFASSTGTPSTATSTMLPDSAGPLADDGFRIDFVSANDFLTAALTCFSSRVAGLGSLLSTSGEAGASSPFFGSGAKGPPRRLWGPDLVSVSAVTGAPDFGAVAGGGSPFFSCHFAFFPTGQS